jgi:DNA-binding NarL/FixJ family response regulator
MSETREHAGSLEIHLDPQNEEELESLLDTVNALMSQCVHDHRPAHGSTRCAEWPPELSDREVEILQLMAEGATAVSVALALT